MAYCQYLHATLLILLIQLCCYKSMLKVTFVFFNFYKRLSPGNASLTNISFACSSCSLSSKVSLVGLLRVSGKVIHSSAAMKAFIPMMPNGSRRCTRFCGHGKIYWWLHRFSCRSRTWINFCGRTIAEFLIHNFKWSFDRYWEINVWFLWMVAGNFMSAFVKLFSK